MAHLSKFWSASVIQFLLKNKLFLSRFIGFLSKDEVLQIGLKLYLGLKL